MGFLVTRTSFVADFTPDSFSFTDQTDVATNSTITSAAITVAGINTAATISVSNGEYDINSSGSFTSSSGTVVNGNTVRARHTSSAFNSTAVNTIVTIGGVSDTFTSTTVAEGGGGDTPNLFVHTDGNDALTRAQVLAGAGDPAQSWETLERAMELAQAGDVVDVVGNQTLAGTTGSGNASWIPTNSGTVGNHIVFQANGAVRLILSSPGTYISNGGESHLTFRGFTFDDATDDSFSSGGLCYMIDGDDLFFDQCTFLGQTGRDEGNNYSGCFIVGCTNVRFRNCLFRDFRGATSDVSHNGIEGYFGAGDVLIEHSEFDNCASGVHPKAIYLTDENPIVTGPWTIRYCYFHDCYEGVHHHRAPFTEADPFLIHNNIFANMDEAGIRLHGFDGGATDPRYMLAVNNTFYNCFKGVRQLGEQVSNAHCLFQNNIVYGGDYGQAYGDEGPVDHSSDRFTWVRNSYTNHAESMAIYEAGDRTLTQWKSDVSSDTDSVESTLTFVSAGTDFHLVSNGQAALTLGRAIHGVGGADGTTIPAGAYITGSEEIGIES